MTSQNIRFIACWLIAGVFEYPFFALFFGRAPFFLDRHPFYSMGLHAAAVAVLFFSTLKIPKTFLFFPAIFPVFGWGAMAAFYFLRRGAPLASSPGGGETGVSAAELREPMSIPMPKQARILEELDFMPLADILAGEEIALKRGAISRLAEIKDAEAIRILLSCRGDPSPDVRFFATSALTRIKKEFDEELEAAKRQMQRDVHSIAARIVLAKIYLQYSRSNLLDSATAEAYEREALYHLEHCVESGNADRAVFQMILSIYMGHQEWDRALKIADQLEKIGAMVPEEIGKLKVDIYFKTGRYEKVIQEMTSMNKIGIQDSQWQSLVNFWGVY
ncbi:MAG: HEAT repeat domain-containing protein [Deltaproteobacteria bacterium]|nr:HEAT repeat domain-containing protein [Deltaproteobacteria bacterium]